MAEIQIDRLRKDYGDFAAVDDVSITIQDGEFFTLLGPSGCGKSTLLSMIAGLAKPDGGSLHVGGKSFYDGSTRKFVLPEKRDIGLVFQSYALWPHMTVAENVGYGLRVQKVPKEEQRTRVADALELVDLAEHGSRYPHELSGGQQQRAALARTVVSRPQVLLLDEPLSNLDAKLRVSAREWIKRIQRETTLTTVYVTHDQEEALAMSDRIAVMHKGRVQQIAKPQELYEHPTNRIVADFIGTTHFLGGRVRAIDADSTTIELHGSTSTLSVKGAYPFSVGSPVDVAVRPENIKLSNEPGIGRVHADILETFYLGGRWGYQLNVGGSTLRVDSSEKVADLGIYLEFQSFDIPVFERPALASSAEENHV